MTDVFKLCTNFVTTMSSLMQAEMLAVTKTVWTTLSYGEGYEKSDVHLLVCHEPLRRPLTRATMFNARNYKLISFLTDLL